MVKESSPRPPVCDYEGSDYQVSFWDQGGRVYEDRVEAIALGRLLPPDGNRLLEVGAGAGRNTPRYQGYRQIVLLDYSRTQLRQAQERLGRGERFIYVVADAYRLPFVPGLFDAATMIRTLHHMADAPAAIHQVRAVLRSQGVFILEFANKRNLKSIVRYWLGRQEWNPFNPEPVEFAELNFDFHPQAVRGWMHAASFQVERQLTVSHFRINMLKRHVPVNWLIALDSVAQLSGDWWQLSPSVFIRGRALGESSPASGFFRCPECGYSPLAEQLLCLCCTGCGRRYPIEDGIYDFKNWTFTQD
jgi:ubiquinone/menaquinone biosynthesis C-methylase UbiE/uncharacterized protein YbaR (Trm112 family)